MYIYTHIHTCICSICMYGIHFQLSGQTMRRAQSTGSSDQETQVIAR